MEFYLARVLLPKDNMQGLNFIAIDFETATGRRASICEAGICVVRDGEVVETRSWLVRPENNFCNRFNISIHGITPRDTFDAPEFPEVWTEISEYLKECPVLVAHNAAFDMSCIRQSLELYGLEKPDVNYYCSLTIARRIYNMYHNSLDYLCGRFGIPCDNHHRAGDDAEMCARLFLQEIYDAESCSIDDFRFCRKKL